MRRSSFAKPRIPMVVTDSKLELAVSHDRVVSGYWGMFVEVDLFVGKSFNQWGYKIILGGEMNDWI